MNRSDLMPKHGRRYQRLKQITRIGSRVGCSAVIAFFLLFGTVSEHLPASTPSPMIPPLINEDELPAGSAGESFNVWEALFDKWEGPSALSIYSSLFAEAEGEIPKGELVIARTDVSQNPAPGQVLMKNGTTYSLSVTDYLKVGNTLSYTASAPPQDVAPKVLIYHTHGTEGYADEGRLSYPAGNLPRSQDITKNVVAVGKVLADTLNALGIPTVHCEIMHDARSYSGAYSYSAETVKEYVEKYPSIEYAFDIHRDALNGGGYAYKAVTYDESRPVAQIMLVVGTDATGTAVNPRWKENLSFAVNTQYWLTKRLSRFVRPVSVLKSTLNQQYTKYGMLVEVGTCVNTLQEAKEAAILLGQTLAAMIREQQTAG